MSALRTSLSEVEVTLLLLLAEGMKQTEAANILVQRGLLGSAQSVRYHLDRIHRLLGVRSTAAAIAVAIKRGILPVPKGTLPPRKGLTEVGHYTLVLIAGDATNREIGGGNENTAKWRVARLLRTLGAKNRCEAVYKGFQFGYLKYG